MFSSSPAQANWSAVPDSETHKRRLLILGGTSEALALADEADRRFGERIEVISSLAGRIEPGRDRRGGLRIGGFGGADGLARYLHEEAINLVVDATHPFADRISVHAAEASAATDIPRLILVRPQWRPQDGEHWLDAESFTAAAEMVSRTARRAWLTTGPGGISAFGWVSSVWFLVRLFQRPDAVLPLRNYEVVVSRPPFPVADERALLVRHRIDTLVTKNSGGPLAGKLEAARAEGVRVVMIARPPAPSGERVETVHAALVWLARRL